MLSDKRLSMKHKTMEQLLMISVNDKIWTKEERESIILNAVDTYMTKRRTVRMHDPQNDHRMDISSEEGSDIESSISASSSNDSSYISSEDDD